MASTTRNRKPPKATLRRQEILQAKLVGPAVGGELSAEAGRDPDELPNREALVERLEAQRADLLRAMASVNLAERTISQHVANAPLGRDRQRALEALSDAGEALRTAYPLLERIAQALAVEEILKQHTPATEATRSESASAATSALPRSR
jgi:hypothetical protein